MVRVRAVREPPLRLGAIIAGQASGDFRQYNQKDWTGAANLIIIQFDPAGSELA